MRTRPFGLGILLFLAIFVPTGLSAQTAADYEYSLGPKSFFQYGCFAPCECPVFSSQPVQGTFHLRHLGFDGLYDNYEVSNVRWTLPDDTTNLVITGSGLYRIGGEVAIQKQLMLDLRFGSRPPQKFDSGLLAGKYDFPGIEIDVSLHQMTCFDSVIHVQAAPVNAVTGVDFDPSIAPARSIRVTPNPFAHETRIDLALAAPARIELAIYDTQGRLVRRLARGYFPAGQQVLWDGRQEDGVECASGVYFLRGRIGDRTAAQRIVKAR
jgi:hypothetical protein